MYKFIIICLVLLFTTDSCKEKGPEPGVNFSGRLMTECANPQTIDGEVLELWEDSRMNGTEVIAEKMVASTTTANGGYFLFRYTFDTVPMSLRVADGNGGYNRLAQGIFGIFNYMNTFNNVVADVLKLGNEAKVQFTLEKPAQWQSGDSLVLQIKNPVKTGGYSFTFNDISGNTLTVDQIRAFTRLMQADPVADARNKKFCFPVTADWYFNGAKKSREYWIGTTTCRPDSLHQYTLKY